MGQMDVALGRGLGLSELAPGVVQSEIRAMTQECDRMGGVNLAQGVCDTEVPEVVAEGAIRAIRDGLNIYTRMDGIERLRRAIAGKVERTPRTRAMVINTPSNPAGKVFTRRELDALAEIAEEFDLFCFTDEIYEHFIYGGAKHVSPAAIPGMRERTILMSGFSKTFSVTGWRVGYLIADAKWVGSIGYFHDLTYVCAPAPMQQGCADGVEKLGAEVYEGLAREHEGKRTMIIDALRDAGMRPHVPDGAYYVLASAANLPGATAAEKARALLAKTGVASVAGSAFFSQTTGRPGRGEDLLRFCFAKKDKG